ncbi:MAG: hypothetical protein GX822_02265 [Alcaligenaceae bacterium]|nr:hypothetical protein [Alcaligenaceae bacterium]
MNNWDYENHSNRHLVTHACQILQKNLASNASAMQKIVTDTRVFHKDIFQNVVPTKQPAFAGNYRGSAYYYLQQYNVQIGEHYGTAAEHVEQDMVYFHDLFKESLAQFELKTAKLSNEEKLVIYSRLIGHFVVTFLTIHPYANGNGHISRLIAWALFCHKGFNITSWDLDKRPDQPFDTFIAMYQQGQKDAMASYFYQLLVHS